MEKYKAKHLKVICRTDNERNICIECFGKIGGKKETHFIKSNYLFRFNFNTKTYDGFRDFDEFVVSSYKEVGVAEFITYCENLKIRNRSAL